MNISKASFGTLGNGTPVTRFILENNEGMTIAAMDYGANLLSVVVPDREGRSSEVTLGFDTLDRYEGDHPFFGATVGRYANRIAGAHFALGGKTYSLYDNDSGNHLHGGKEGFDKRMWDAEIEADGAKGAIRFHRVSPDGEEGYPGSLDTTVTFVLTEENELFFEYEATSDAQTPVNLTNHTYWNLSGPGNTVLDHSLTLSAGKLLAIDEALIPTGDLMQAVDTPFDFSAGKTLGREIEAAGGYDHCFVLDGEAGTLRQAAALKDPATGRCMSIETTQPAAQVYTANMLEDTVGRSGITFRKHGAVCIETGGYNNAVNIPAFPDSVLRPGQTYRHTTRHRFWAE